MSRDERTPRVRHRRRRIRRPLDARHRPAARRLLVVRPVLGRLGHPRLRVPGHPRHRRRTHRHLLHAALADRGRRDASWLPHGSSRSRSRPASRSSLGLLSLGRWIALAYLPTGWILVAFVLVGIGNGLIDVYLNVAAQRVESRDGQDRSCSGSTRATRSAASRARPSPGAIRAAGHRLPARARVRGRGAGGTAVLDVDAACRRERQSGRGRHCSRSRRSSGTEAPGAGARRAVGVPGRGVDGHLVGALSARGAGGLRGRRGAWRSSRSRRRCCSGGCSPAACCSAWGHAHDDPGGRASARWSAARSPSPRIRCSWSRSASWCWGSRSSAAVPAAFGLVGESGEDPTNAHRGGHHGRLHRLHLEPADPGLGGRELQPPGVR